MKSTTNQKLFRVFFYTLGMVILSLGIILNTKSGLGVSPIISVAFTYSKILNMNFGDASMIMYVVLALAEYALEGKNFKLYDLLQIPLSFAVTRLFNIFGSLLPDTQSVTQQFICLFFGITLTGLGAAMSLNARMVPNPGDGIIQAISDRVGKPVGLCKNCFDIGCVILSAISGLVFTGHIIGLSIGTICAMIFVGRVIALYNMLFKDKTLELMGLSTVRTTESTIAEPSM